MRWRVPTTPGSIAPAPSSRSDGPTYRPLIIQPVGEWNQYEISVNGADFTVSLNGQVVNRFQFTGHRSRRNANSLRRRKHLASLGLQPIPGARCSGAFNGRGHKSWV